MATAREKIRSGLDSKSGYSSKSDTRKAPRLLHLVGKKHTIASIHLNQRKAVQAYTKLCLLAEKAATTMAELEEGIRADWDERAWTHDTVNGTPVRRPVMDASEVRRNIDRDLKRAQAAVNQETAEELNKLMAVIREAKSQNAAFRKGAKSPYGQLLSETVGDERMRLAEGLERDGVVAIEDAMARALGDNDRLLAAAACVAYDRLSDEQRQLVSYSRDDVAEALVWNDWQAKQIALEKTLYAVDMAEALADKITGKEAGTKKISIAERFHSKAKQLGVEFDENDLNPPASAMPAPEVKAIDNMPTKPELPEDALAKMARLYREGKDGEAVALGIASGLLTVDKDDKEGGQDHADAP